MWKMLNFFDNGDTIINLILEQQTPDIQPGVSGLVNHIALGIGINSHLDLHCLDCCFEFNPEKELELEKELENYFDINYEHEDVEVWKKNLGILVIAHLENGLLMEI